MWLQGLGAPEGVQGVRKVFASFEVELERGTTLDGGLARTESLLLHFPLTAASTRHLWCCLATLGLVQKFKGDE
jgi:hypothetical protein